MPNLTAREMLLRLPMRMAEGGTVDTAPGVSAAYRKAMQAGGQQTVDDYYANLRKDAAAYLANPNAPTGVDAYNLMIESGISTSDLRNAGVADEVLNKIFSVKMPIIPQSQFVTPTGMTSAYERSPDLAFESQRLTALGQDGRAILDKQGRDYIANLQQGGIDAAERAQMLEYATERGYSFDDLLKAGVDPNVLFTRPQAAPPPPPFPDPVPYTPITVYQPITPQPDMFAAGQPALDTAFRESSPRTAIPGMPGQFDYSPAAKLRPATGSGFTFTPPSITTRPRSLLSPREIQAYGGLTSASQRFAQNRQTIDNNLRRLRQSIPALNDIRNYNQLRNMVMSGFFGADPLTPSDPLAVFDPKTTEAQNLQKYLAGLPPPRETTPEKITVKDGMTGTDVEVEAPVYGGYLFSKGGAVKKSDGSARDQLPRFQAGGDVSARTSLSPNDPLYIREDASVSVDDLLRTPEPEIEQTESRSMLDRLKGAGRFLNEGFYERISKPAVGAAVDMTVGLGDLAQRGARYLGNRAGFDAGEFTPAAPRVREALGVEGYDPYALGSIATQILPFAAAGRAATSAPAVARQFDTMFPNLGRESGAYVGGETAAAAAREIAPDSTAAELFASVAGSMGGASALDVPPMSRIDAPTGDEPPAGSAASMLDELENAADASPIRLAREETQAIDKAVKNRNKRQKLKTEARRIKGNFLPENGWAPIQAVGVEKGKPAFKDIPYGFEKPPAGMEKEAWANSLSDNLVREVDGVVERARSGDQAAVNILRQANWYRTMRDQLRSEFGGIGDVFADVLGTTSAQTNVEQNFRNATEILRRYSRGDFDAELQAYENRIKQGLPVDGKALTALHNSGEFPLITSSSGKLFNTNSPSSMGALLGMFRSVKMGSAPKTPNFTGNLIGLTNEATIDVWAGRFLRRLSGQSRVPPVAEKAVTGKHLKDSSLENPRVGGEFGFGQDVFRSAADRINAAGGVKSVIPEMGDLGPDDLQAVAWFMEKELWTKNGWTTKAGEGGSLEYEMSLAGGADQVRIDSLRREINAGFKAPNKRKKETDAEYAERVAQARRVYDNRQELAEIELRGLESPLQRYTLGVSGEIRNREGVPDKLMSNYEQAELAAEFDDVLRNDQSVRGYNLANAYGLFAGEKERSLNAEIVVGEDFNPDALTRRLVEQGKFYDQDAVFISKSVDASAPNARPGVELYFRKAVPIKTLEALTQRLRDKGIDGFTSITDMRFGDKVNRQSRSGDPETASLTGLRFQYVPEFDGSFDPSKADEIYARQAKLYRDVIEEIGAEGNVSDARLTYYDTKIFFRDDYDDYLTRTASTGNSRPGGELLRGANDSQPNNGGSAREELSKLVPDGVGQASRASPQEGINNSAVTSSRQMLDNLIGKKPEGQRVDATGLQGFAQGLESSAGSAADDFAALTGKAPTETAKNKSGDPLGINIAVDPRNGTDYADLIVSGAKKFESRETASLKPYVGKRVGIVRTGAGQAEVIGSVEIGQPIEVNEKQFNELRDQHLVAEDSSFNIKKDQTKFLYPMINPTSTPPQKVTSKGIVARAVPIGQSAADDLAALTGKARTPTEKSPVPSYYMDEWTQETGLSPQEIENFWRLGDNQRGLPEHLMVKAQRVLGGGVLFPAIEHIGDLTNRMTPKHSLGFAYEETLGKAQRYLRSLKSGYGFRREFEENLRNNAQFNGESLEEHRSKVNAALDAYADAHEKLVTYNPLQTLARDAAVSLGRRDFEKAATLLQDFVDRIPTREDFVAQMRVTPEPDLTKLSSRELKQKLQDIQEKRKARQGLEGSTPTPAVQTETPEFKNFFGESKVTDAGGQPLVVYHGTDSDFTAFRPSESGLLGRGIYLSSEKRVAEGFRGADKLMPIYASMKNPAYEHDLIPKRVGDKMKGDEYEKELHDRAIAGGFDGIIKGSSTDVFGNPRTPDSWGNFVVFSPTQIKSATDNVGTFDPSNPVITKAKGGLATKSNVERVRNDNRRYL